MRLKPGNYGKETSLEVRNFDAQMSLDEYTRLPKHPQNTSGRAFVPSIYR